MAPSEEKDSNTEAYEDVIVGLFNLLVNFSQRYAQIQGFQLLNRLNEQSRQRIIARLDTEDDYANADEETPFQPPASDFIHLFMPKCNDEMIAEIQAKVDAYWKEANQIS